MIDVTKNTGRYLRCGYSLATALVRFIILILATAASPTLSFVSCERVDMEGVPEVGAEVRDSTSCRTVFTVGAGAGVLDLFVYKDEGLIPLEKHIHCPVKAGNGPVTIGYDGEEADKLFVCIRSDGRTVWNVAALSRYEAIEQLSFHLTDENPSIPYAVCFGQFRQGDSVSMKPVPLLSEIRLRSISHQFGNYRRLEDPLIFLRGANSSVFALQESGFHDCDHLYDTTGLRGLVWDRLPFDIGMYTQYPNTSVFCYPFDAGASQLEVIVEGIHNSDTVRFVTRLDSLPHTRPDGSPGGLVTLDLEIGSTPDDYRFTADF